MTKDYIKKRPPPVSAEKETRKVVLNRIAVVVLGMHRSGTSALAGMLHLLGCDMAATPMKPTEANKKGYFESDLVYGMHSDLLASAGSSWDDWLPINAGWFESLHAEEYHERAVDVLKGEFGKSRLFVLKDPRICRLVPFWEQVFDESEISPRYVLTHRNPHEVAVSLSTRDGMEMGVAHLIWLRSQLDAENTTRGAVRCFVNFEQLLVNWGGVADKMQDKLDLRLPHYSLGAIKEVNRFLEDGQRHFIKSSERAKADPMLSEWVRDVYQIFEKWAVSGEDAADFAALDTIRHGLTGTGPTFAAIIDSGHDQARTASKEQEEVLAALNVMTSDRDAISDSLATLRADFNKKIEELHIVKAECEELHSTLTGAETEIEALEIELKAAQIDHDLLHVETKSRLGQMETTLGEQISSAEEVRRKLTEKVTQLESRLNTSYHELANLTQILADREKEAEATLSIEKDRGDCAEAAFAAMRTSTSWKMTAPLRWVAQRLRR